MTLMTQIIIVSLFIDAVLIYAFFRTRQMRRRLQYAISRYEYSSKEVDAFRTADVSQIDERLSEMKREELSIHSKFIEEIRRIDAFGIASYGDVAVLFAAVTIIEVGIVFTYAAEVIYY